MPAPTLTNGFPGGRALCPACEDFVAIENGLIAGHHAFRRAGDEAEARDRAEWFNATGWN